MVPMAVNFFPESILLLKDDFKKFTILKKGIGIESQKTIQTS